MKSFLTNKPLESVIEGSGAATAFFNNKLCCFFKKGSNPASFCLFSLFSHNKKTINDKSVDGVLGIRTQAVGW